MNHSYKKNKIKQILWEILSHKLILASWLDLAVSYNYDKCSQKSCQVSYLASFNPK